jgi:hypothetical protein
VREPADADVAFALAFEPPALRKWPNSAVLLWSGFFSLLLNLLASSVSRPVASTTKRARQLRRAPSSSSACTVAPSASNATSRTLQPSMACAPRVAALRNSISSSSERRTCQAESSVLSQPSPELDIAAVVVVGRDELDAELGHADLLDLVAHAELLEQLDIRGQQRFADVEARVVRLLEQHHLAALRASSAAMVEPAGPPPTTSTSQDSSAVWGVGAEA